MSEHAELQEQPLKQTGDVLQDVVEAGEVDSQAAPGSPKREQPSKEKE